MARSIYSQNTSLTNSLIPFVYQATFLHLSVVISDIMDKKLQPLKEDMEQLRLQNENIIIPRLENIENTRIMFTHKKSRLQDEARR